MDALRSARDTERIHLSRDATHDAAGVNVTACCRVVQMKLSCSHRETLNNTVKLMSVITVQRTSKRSRTEQKSWNQVPVRTGAAGPTMQARVWVWP